MRELRKESNCHSGMAYDKLSLIFTVNLTLVIFLFGKIKICDIIYSGIKYKSVFNCNVKTFKIHKIIASIQKSLYIFSNLHDTSNSGALRASVGGAP